MNELCLLTNMTSSEVAAWVQAFGALLALGVAFFVVWWQHRAQLKHQENKEWTQEYEQLGSVLGLLRFGYNVLDPVVHATTHTYTFTDHLQNKFEIRQLERIDEVLSELPLTSALRPHLMLEMLAYRDTLGELLLMLKSLRTTGAIPQTGEQFAGWVATLKKAHSTLEASGDAFQRERERMLMGES